jgi:tetratricopeptide (TPR) repeat protein
LKNISYATVFVIGFCASLITFYWISITWTSKKSQENPISVLPTSVPGKNLPEMKPELKEQILPKKPPLTFKLAISHKKTSKPKNRSSLKKMIESYKAFLAQHPKHVKATIAMARLYQQLGDTEKADAFYEKALQMTGKKDILLEWKTLKKNPDKYKKNTHSF